MWEYKKIIQKYAPTEELMNKLGKEGWEHTSTTHGHTTYVLYFKRPLKEKELKHSGRIDIPVDYQHYNAPVDEKEYIPKGALYAFEGIDSDSRIMHLTAKEFEMFFSHEPPEKAQKALAYSKFTVGGTSFIRIPFTPKE